MKYSIVFPPKHDTNRVLLLSGTISYQLFVSYCLLLSVIISCCQLLHLLADAISYCQFFNLFFFIAQEKIKVRPGSAIAGFQQVPAAHHQHPRHIGSALYKDTDILVLLS